MERDVVKDNRSLRKLKERVAILGKESSDAKQTAVEIIADLDEYVRLDGGAERHVCHDRCVCKHRHGATSMKQTALEYEPVFNEFEADLEKRICEKDRLAWFENEWREFFLCNIASAKMCKARTEAAIIAFKKRRSEKEAMLSSVRTESKRRRIETSE